MGFSRQEYWTGLSCPPQGDLPNPGIEPMSPALQANSLPTDPPGKPKTRDIQKILFAVYLKSNLTEHVIFFFAMSSNTSFVPTLIWQKRLDCASMRLLQSL